MLGVVGPAARRLRPDGSGAAAILGAAASRRAVAPAAAAAAPASPPLHLGVAASRRRHQPRAAARLSVAARLAVAAVWTRCQPRRRWRWCQPRRCYPTRHRHRPRAALAPDSEPTDDFGLNDKFFERPRRPTDEMQAWIGDAPAGICFDNEAPSSRRRTFLIILTSWSRPRWWLW